MLSAVIRSALGYPAFTVGTITGHFFCSRVCFLVMFGLFGQVLSNMFGLRMQDALLQIPPG